MAAAPTAEPKSTSISEPKGKEPRFRNHDLPSESLSKPVPFADSKARQESKPKNRAPAPPFAPFPPVKKIFKFQSLHPTPRNPPSRSGKMLKRKAVLHISDSF
jgi:hypothetical protein